MTATITGSHSTPLDIESIRADFPTLQGPGIYLDSVATSLTPLPVIESMTEYYMKYRANVNRGVYDLSLQASARYEQAMNNIASFIGAGPEELVFTANATHALNEVALTLEFNEGDEVLLSSLEHSSNVLPWMRLGKTAGVNMRVYNPGKAGVFDLDEFAGNITERTKLISLTHVSNVLGTVVPVKEVGKLCRERGILFMVDAAQSVPHLGIDVKDIDCDFLAFSGHKMLGPTGIGVLYLKREHARSLIPAILGGGSVDTTVCHGVSVEGCAIDSCAWNDLPYKWAAGTPPIAELLGLSTAIDYLRGIGMDRIHAHDQHLTTLALAGLADNPHVDLFGPDNAEQRNAIVSFNLGDLSASEVGRILDERYNIAVRAGEHCAVGYFMGAEQADPYLGNIRASFYLYNSEDEVARFIKAINEISAICT